MVSKSWIVTMILFGFMVVGCSGLSEVTGDSQNSGLEVFFFGRDLEWIEAMADGSVGIDEVRELTRRVRDEDIVAVNWSLQEYVLDYGVYQRLRLDELVNPWAVVFFDGVFQFWLDIDHSVESVETADYRREPMAVLPTGMAHGYALMRVCPTDCRDWSSLDSVPYPAEEWAEIVEDSFVNTGKWVGEYPAEGYAFTRSGDSLVVAVGCSVVVDEIRLIGYEEAGLASGGWEIPEERILWGIESEGRPQVVSVIALGKAPEGFVEVAPYVSEEGWGLPDQDSKVDLVLFSNGVEVRTVPLYSFMLDVEDRAWSTPLSGPGLTWAQYQDLLLNYPALIGGNCSVREPDPLG